MVENLSDRKPLLVVKIPKPRGGDNPQVIIENFEKNYTSFKAKVDELDDGDPHKQAVLKDFSKFSESTSDGSSLLVEDQKDFIIARQKLSDEELLGFTEMLVPSYFQLDPVSPVSK